MLSETHRCELELGSGITRALVDARGYATVAAKEAATFGFSPAQQLAGLMIPYWFDGQIVMRQLKPDKPRAGEKGKTRKYEVAAGSKPRLDAHPMIWGDVQNPEIPLWLTEGVKKADAASARGLCCIALIGVYGFLGANEKGGVCELDDWGRIPFKATGGKARDVYIVFDSDSATNPNVRKAMLRLAKMVKGRGGRVHLIQIPPGPNGGKVGLDDYLCAQGSSISALYGFENSSLGLDGAIRCDGRDLSEIVADGIQALSAANDPPTLFTRDGGPVEVMHSEGIASLEPLSSVQVRHKLAEASKWMIPKGKGMVECSPPRDVSESITQSRALPFPPIVATTRGPVLSPDGTLSEKPGYCPASRMWLDLAPIVPFKGDAISAANWLRAEIFSQYDFAGESDWAHTLALCLLPIVRPVIGGPTPLHLIGAPVQAVGKSKLATVCLMMTQGDDVGSTPMSVSEEETRKRITESLRAGSNYLLLDNLTGCAASPALSVMLTAGVWRDRRNYGGIVQYRVTQTLVATANNPALDKDLLTRSVRIWIDPQCEHPEDRGGFKDIVGFVRENRQTVQGALVAIVKAWVAAGMPRQTAAVSRFDSWAYVMGGILQTAGVQGFLGNMAEMREASGGMERAWSRFYEKWERVRGLESVSGSDLYEMFNEDDELAVLCIDSSDRSARLRFGGILRGRVGVVCAGLKIAKTDTGYRMVENPGREAAKRLIDVATADEPELPRVVV